MVAAPIDRPYEQTAYWKDLLASAGTVLNADELFHVTKGLTVEAQAHRFRHQDKGLTSIIHLAFENDVVPVGGALLGMVQSDGRLGQFDRQRLEALGYLIEEGVVARSDDVPIGRAFNAIMYWGGDRQHHRWHMASPAIVNPSRRGDPCFMDGAMVAFRVDWKDLDRFSDAITSLWQTLITGVSGDPVGNLRAIRIHWMI